MFEASFSLKALEPSGPLWNQLSDSLSHLISIAAADMQPFHSEGIILIFKRLQILLIYASRTKNADLKQECLRKPSLVSLDKPIKTKV